MATTDPARNPNVWWVVAALIMLAVFGSLAYRCNEQQELEDRRIRFQQEERDNPGIHDLQQKLGR